MMNNCVKKILYGDSPIMLKNIHIVSMCINVHGTLKNNIKSIIIKTLIDTKGNKAQAARILNISKTTMYAKMRKLIGSIHLSFDYKQLLNNELHIDSSHEMYNNTLNVYGTLENNIKIVILKALIDSKGIKRHASEKVLRISKTTLYNKMELYNIPLNSTIPEYEYLREKELNECIYAAQVRKSNSEIQ